MLLATSVRINQAFTVRTIRSTSELQLPTPPAPNNHFLNLFLVVTLRYSVPIVLILLDDILNEMVGEKGIFVRQMSGNCRENRSSRFCRYPETQMACEKQTGAFREIHIGPLP